MRRAISIPFCFSLLLAACSTPVVKPKAFEQNVLKRSPLPASMFTQSDEHERVLDLGTRWLSDIDPQEKLTFVGYRKSPTFFQFCLVVRLEPDNDLLWLFPLEEGETSLSVLKDDTRRTELKELVGYLVSDETKSAHKQKLLKLSLSEVIAEKKFGSPLPTPRFIFGVAANYPSHLEHDLHVDFNPSKREVLSRARPRVFLKFPPTYPPGKRRLSVEEPIDKIIGPYDTLIAPKKVVIPSPEDERHIVPANIDYEAEIGVVIGKELSWENVKDATEEELRAAVLGYVLANDTKLRNSQAMLVIMTYGQAPEESDPYWIDDKELNSRFGTWNKNIAQWWSYAASWGQYSALGPFFVAAPADHSFPDRALISARTYASAEERRAEVPKGRYPHLAYLRQCSLTTDDDKSLDRLIWSVPQILRSILKPDSALRFIDGELKLLPGDVISLGTPGGTVITSKSPTLVKFGKTALFWFKPIDWHNKFFKADLPLYLRDGDELFMWAEGLGYQHMDIRQIDTLDYAAPIAGE